MVSQEALRMGQPCSESSVSIILPLLKMAWAEVISGYSSASRICFCFSVRTLPGTLLPSNFVFSSLPLLRQAPPFHFAGPCRVGIAPSLAIFLLVGYVSMSVFIAGLLAWWFLGRILGMVTFLCMLICQSVDSVSLNHKFSYQQSSPAMAFWGEPMTSTSKITSLWTSVFMVGVVDRENVQIEVCAVWLAHTHIAWGYSVTMSGVVAVLTFETVLTSLSIHRCSENYFIKTTGWSKSFSGANYTEMLCCGGKKWEMPLLAAREV